MSAVNAPCEFASGIAYGRVTPCGAQSTHVTGVGYLLCEAHALQYNEAIEKNGYIKMKEKYIAVPRT